MSSESLPQCACCLFHGEGIRYLDSKVGGNFTILSIGILKSNDQYSVNKKNTPSRATSDLVLCKFRSRSCLVPRPPSVFFILDQVNEMN